MVGPDKVRRVGGREHSVWHICSVEEVSWGDESARRRRRRKRAVGDTNAILVREGWLGGKVGGLGDGEVPLVKLEMSTLPSEHSRQRRNCASLYELQTSYNRLTGIQSCYSQLVGSLLEKS